MQSASISNGAMNGSINPRLSKSKQISPTLPGGTHIGSHHANNYYQDNKEKSPRRQSQYANDENDDSSPGLGAKNQKIKGGSQAFNQASVPNTNS